MRCPTVSLLALFGARIDDDSVSGGDQLHSSMPDVRRIHGVSKAPRRRPQNNAVAMRVIQQCQNHTSTSLLVLRIPRLRRQTPRDAHRARRQHHEHDVHEVPAEEVVLRRRREERRARRRPDRAHDRRCSKAGERWDVREGERRTCDLRQSVRRAERTLVRRAGGDVHEHAS